MHPGISGQAHCGTPVGKIIIFGKGPLRGISIIHIFEGDLGSCKLFKSLHALHHPSSYPHSSLNDSFSIMGAAHVLWNIGQAIFQHHFGNTSDQSDMEAVTGWYVTL